MCRTSGARHRYTPRTQRSRAGLTSDAPTALALTRGPKQHTFRHQCAHGPSSHEKTATDCGDTRGHDCHRRVAAGRRTDCTVAGARPGAFALARDHAHGRLCDIAALADFLDPGGLAGGRGVWPRLALGRGEL